MKHFFVLAFSVCLLFACKKESNSNSNPTPNPTPVNDTTLTDTLYATISKTPILGVAPVYSCCVKIIWGDGLITNFGTQIDKFSHTYNDSAKNDTYFVLSAKGLTSINFDVVAIYAMDYLGIISNFDFSKCPNLENINFSQRKTTYINIDKCYKLKVLSCSYNKISTLNLSTNYNLQTLKCDNNKINYLDIKKDTSLIVAECQDNLLNTIDITNNKKITNLNCSNNKLTNVVISSKSNIREIKLSDNLLTTSAINILFDSLPTITNGSNNYKVYIKNNPGTVNCNTILANTKGWSVITN